MSKENPKAPSIHFLLLGKQYKICTESYLAGSCHFYVFVFSGNWCLVTSFQTLLACLALLLLKMKRVIHATSAWSPETTLNNVLYEQGWEMDIQLKNVTFFPFPHHYRNLHVQINDHCSSCSSIASVILKEGSPNRYIKMYIKKNYNSNLITLNFFQISKNEWVYIILQFIVLSRTIETLPISAQITIHRLHKFWESGDPLTI